MEKVSISNIKIKDSIPVIVFDTVDAVGKPMSLPGAEFTDPVHPDFQLAMNALGFHLAQSTEMESPNEWDLNNPSEEVFSRYHMHGLSIKAGKNAGVTLSGHKIKSDGGAFNFNSPFIRFTSKDEDVFLESLISKVERLKQEASAYIDGSKRGNEGPNLFNQPPPPEPTTKAQIVPPVVTAGTFKVETAAGGIELPILRENGVIAEIETEDPTLTATFTKGALEEEPFERKLMAPFPEDEKKAAKAEKALKEIKQAKVVNRKRTQQTANNPSGEVKE